MSESQLLSQVQAAFEPYVKSSDQLYDVRVQIAKYIASVQPQETDAVDLPYSIPAHVTGLRRRYLQALHANIKAKRQYAKLQEQVKAEAVIPVSDSSSADATQTHLTVLHLRRQHQKHQVVSHYLSEAERLASQNQIFETQLPTPNTSASEIRLPLTSLKETPSQVIAHTKDLTRNLELAILQAHQELKRTRQLLENDKARGLIPENPTPEAKLRALVATNRELTKWIEESLARCDASATNGAQIDLLNNGRDEIEDIDHEATINEQYEKYIAARTRLLDAVAELTAPLPASPPIDIQTQQAPNNPTVRSHNPPTASILPFLTSQYIPLLNMNETLQQSQTHIDILLRNHAQILEEQLLRLSDESHLLPAYPILVRPKKGNTELSETEKLLGAWKFAMDAAGTATEAVVERQVRIGEVAVGHANVALDGIEEEQRLWEDWGRARK